MAGWSTTKDLFYKELEQMRDEGAAVNEAEWKKRLEALGDDREKIEALYDELTALPVDEELAAKEPNELDKIRALRTDGPRKMAEPKDEAKLLDQLHGAWLGRSAGCALGKPFERSPFFFGPNQRKAIETYLKAADAWPLDFYIPGKSPVGKLEGIDLRSEGIEDEKDTFNIDEDGYMYLGCNRSHRENIECMESDDDIRYTLIGLLVAEQHGADWATADMAKTWLRSLTFGQVCTAETQAYMNLVNVDKRFDYSDVDWTHNATYRNPFREWIGAQIRADHFGYAAAGNPELAADYAWRDARLSHTRNGIYGEMFFAAAIAAAFSTSDIHEIINAAMAEIPAECRLAICLREVIEKYDALDRDWEATWDWFRFEHPWGKANYVHTIPNAVVCVLALLHSEGDFEKTIVYGVLGGMDTDCNGATVGSIAGILSGGANAPAKWVDPLHDTIDSGMPAFLKISMRELAGRSLEIYKATKTLIG
ncbi:MAG: ADP-ribosylglycohydrolase family protein [Candidatus Sumerlaeota bacterium]